MVLAPQPFPYDLPAGTVHAVLWLCSGSSEPAAAPASAPPPVDEPPPCARRGITAIEVAMAWRSRLRATAPALWSGTAGWADTTVTGAITHALSRLGGGPFVWYELLVEPLRVSTDRVVPRHSPTCVTDPAASGTRTLRRACSAIGSTMFRPPPTTHAMSASCWRPQMHEWGFDGVTGAEGLLAGAIGR